MYIICSLIKWSGLRVVLDDQRSLAECTNGEDGWEHQTITLEPLNPDRQPIEIHAEEASGIRVIGEFVDVVAAI